MCVPFLGFIFYSMVIPKSVQRSSPLDQSVQKSSQRTPVQALHGLDHDVPAEQPRADAGERQPEALPARGKGRGSSTTLLRDLAAEFLILRNCKIRNPIPENQCSQKSKQYTLWTIMYTSITHRNRLFPPKYNHIKEKYSEECLLVNLN